MQEQFARTEILIGDTGIQKLNNAKVAIFGIRWSRLICCRSFDKSWSTEHLF